MSLNPGRSDATRKRINTCMQETKPLVERPNWSEQRLAVDFGGHTYIVNSGQIFQCAHCGHYDPKWSVTEVLDFLKEIYGVKPYEIEVFCSVAIVPKS
jgi:hypothetical protein